MVIPYFVGPIHEADESGEPVAYERSVRGRAYVQKARFELASLEDEGVVTAGNAFSPVLFVKGVPGAAERAGDALLAGADGKALRASLLALGYAPEEWAAMAAWRKDGGALSAELVRLAVATLDPATLVACDEAAADVVRDAYAQELFSLADLGEAMLTAGLVAQVAGMRMLNLGGFEDALADDHQKQVMWAYLKQIPPLREPY